MRASIAELFYSIGGALVESGWDTDYSVGVPRSYTPL